MSTFRIVVDRSLCSGFGACAELAPDVFELEGGIASVRVGETADPAAAYEAADACPMGAISVIEVQAA
jgi:ferredoxin